MRPQRLVMLALASAGCATMAPDEWRRNELQLGAARQCERQFATITVQGVDSFGRLQYSYYLDHERASFAACYDEALKQRLKAQGVAAESRVTARPQPPQASTPVIDLPAWAIGDEWEYRWSSPRGNGRFVYTVAGEEDVDGVACWVVRAGQWQYLHRKSDLGLHVERRQGVVHIINSPPELLAVYPLTAKRRWTQLFLKERPVERRSDMYALTCETATSEEVIMVPAGTFTTLRVTCRWTHSNELVRTRWYSAEVKRFIREEVYLDYGTHAAELVSYRSRP